jgi:PAS domain S-box-containing protein
MKLVNLSLLLIGIGIFFMQLALMKTRTILVMIKDKTESNSWRILFFMMLFFLAGYIVTLYLIFSGQQKLIAFLTGTVFLLGALFVFIITRVSAVTINNLIIKDKSLELNKELKTNEAIIKQKSDALENVNKELENERKQLEVRIKEGTSELMAVNIKLKNEIEEHKKTEQELVENKNRLQKQNNALHIVTKCLKVSSDNLTESIPEITKTASETINTECVSLWLYDEFKTSIRCIDLYENSKKKHSDGVVLYAKNYPDYFKALELNHIIDANDALKDPRTYEYSENYSKPLGITSILNAPIRKSGQMIGFITFEHIGTQRIWTIDEQLFAAAIADSISILLESIERIKAEKTLEEKEKQLSSIFDTVGDSIFVISPEKDGRYKFVSVNKVFETTTGIKINQVLGKYVDEIIPPSSINVVLEKYKKAILEKKIIRWEEVSDYPTGQLTGEISIAPIFDENGNCSFLVGSVHDITDRKINENKIIKLNEELEERVKERTSELLKTQISLQLREEMYRKIVEEAGDCVYSSDYNGYFTYLNPICKKFTGYTENELIGKHYLDIIAPEWKEKVAKFYKDQFDNKIQETLFSFLIITKSGEKKWVEQIVTQQKDGDKIIGHHSIVRDITNRKKDEEELKQKTMELELSNKELKNSEQQIQLIFDRAPDAVIVINHESTILKWNHKAEKLFGWDESDIIGKHLYEYIIPERYRERHKAGMKHYLETGEGPVLNKDIEIEAINKKGNEFSVLLSISPVDINDEKLFIGFVRDITEKKKNELLIAQKSLELERSNKDLEQFAYVASHDLQEPLRMVNSYLTLLSKRYKDKLDKDANDFIYYAVDGSNRMRTLILSLLDYSRVNRVRPLEDINLNALLKEVLNDLKNQIEENKAVITIEPLPDIYGDKVLIGQLFQNLISNAVKFKGERNPEILISGKRNNGEYLFSIKDNGIGIQKENADKLFVIFQRLNTKEEYPGTGIGLAICKKIVEKHGGKIWFESEFGKGTTFYFTIKAKEEKQENVITEEQKNTLVNTQTKELSKEAIN